MLDFLFRHARLFARQLWQFLQRLGQNLLALIIAVLMPIGIWLGLPALFGRSTGAEVNAELFTNLIEVALPLAEYEEIPQPDAAERRGPMAEARPDLSHWILRIEAPVNSSESVLLPNQPLSLNRFNPFDQPYSTTFPDAALHLVQKQIEVRPLWMYA
ncbi:hypothetical protein [Leptolyngbya sp. 7M]|uniref:hypothetical protein n=1 Tax=Leptolyngbya sp. 7M TaxID=2812896 RepID=UPI001B8AB38A|nr:hypothetical protein [Leptolyngbya sp. 7M]QYO63004.1 hypothetical protein JVX88_23850 [Leptolyngbya sp. 7M]